MLVACLPKQTCQTEFMLDGDVEAGCGVGLADNDGAEVEAMRPPGL